jgi:hypothetical protein
MGGHGALTLFLKHPSLYKSVSAFAPIANPIACPWGQKAFSGYLGEEKKEEWKGHDASELLRGWKKGGFETLIDVGTGDNFYKQGQLLPEKFEEAARESGNEKGVVVRYQDVSPTATYHTIERKADGRGINRDTTTPTSSSRHSPRIMLTMLLNTYLHSMFLKERKGDGADWDRSGSERDRGKL